MHQAALLGHGMEDARMYGWDFDPKGKHLIFSYKNQQQ